METSTEPLPRKLHLGCGTHVLPGWLNVDVLPRRSEVRRMDATQPFPFADGSFDYIYSEHMIEHLSYEQGQAMLKECWRALSDRGLLRLSTPDLAFLVELYRNPKSELQAAYIAWASQRWTPGAPAALDTFVINNYVREWGHQFIYDEKVLRLAMAAAGFQAIRKCELNASGDAELRGLEREQRMPAGFLRLESMVLEGAKRAA